MWKTLESVACLLDVVDVHHFLSAVHNEAVLTAKFRNEVQ